MPKILIFIAMLFLVKPVMAQTAGGGNAPAVKVTLKSSGIKRVFYSVSLQELDQNKIGAVLQAFYNAKTFTVTSTLLEGNQVEISSSAKLDRPTVENEIRGIVAQVIAGQDATSGEKQMFKFNQK